MLWITNHPKSLKGMWPRRAGVNYIEGPPKATEAHSVCELSAQGIVGAWVNMEESEYRKLPLVRNPQELKLHPQV